MMELGLAQYDAGDFLALYAGLIALGLLLAIVVPMMLRPVGEPAQPANSGQYAALASGKSRYAEAVMADLLASGRLEIEGKTFRVTDRQPAMGGAETRLMSLGDNFGWRSFARSIDGSYQADRDALVAAGLLNGPGQALPVRLVAVVPMVAIVLLGLYRFRAGQAEGEPVGILAVMIALGVVAIAWRLLAGIRRTREGDRAMKEARQENLGLKRAPTNDQMALGVAIFGTAVLAGTPHDPLHAMRHGSGDAGGGAAGDGGGDGGSGCGGGGCGGCGG